MNVATLKKRILRLIGETPAGAPVAGNSVDADTLLDSINAALEAIALTYYWKMSRKTLTGDGTVTEFTLPEGAIRPEGVLRNSVFLRSPIMEPLATLDDNEDVWLPFPTGKISFTRVLVADEEVILYYAAAWASVANDDDDLETPDYAAQALSFYAASYCLLPSATQYSDISQWKTKVDSGSPEDNPRARMANFLYRRYEMAAAQLPTPSKGVTQ